MALNKTIVNDMGIPVQYWKITNININLNLNYVDISVSGFLSKETRDGNLNPVESKKYRATREDFIKAFSVKKMNESENIIAMGYDFLKTFDEFKNAENI